LYSRARNVFEKGKITIERKMGQRKAAENVK
jgi:hypothetical protein